MKTTLLLAFVVIGLIVLLISSRESYIGATERNRKRYPWFVSLGPDSSNPMCGGVLVHPKLIITAGHCVNDMLKTAWLVDENGKQQEAKVTEIVKKYEKLKVDIAVVVVNTPFKSKTISIGAQENLTHGTDIHAVGHGVDESGMGGGPVKKTTVAFVNPGSCYYDTPEPTFFCTKSRRRGACFGDSGGPAFVRHSKTDFLVGITSHGPRACGKVKDGDQEYLYTVYTDLTNPVTLKLILDLLVSLV